MVTLAIKFIGFLFKVTIGLACVVLGLITIGALIAAIFSVFPVVGIILAVIVLSVAVCYVISFVKNKKEEKLYKRNNNENSIS
ncbi:MAG: hypothetical protein IJE72_03975 [Clostridia bacterium]|nr:hypothetical protein [Clostridia bacterium]